MEFCRISTFTRSFCWLIKNRNCLTTLDKTIKDNARIVTGRVNLNEWIRARKEYQSMALNFLKEISQIKNIFKKF